MKHKLQVMLKNNKTKKNPQHLLKYLFSFLQIDFGSKQKGNGIQVGGGQQQRE